MIDIWFPQQGALLPSPESPFDMMRFCQAEIDASDETNRLDVMMFSIRTLAEHLNTLKDQPVIIGADYAFVHEPNSNPIVESDVLVDGSIFDVRIARPNDTRFLLSLSLHPAKIGPSDHSSERALTRGPVDAPIEHIQYVELGEAA